MATTAREKKVTVVGRDDKIVDGIQKHLQGVSSLQLAGSTYSLADLVKLLQSRATQVAAVTAANATWHAAIACGEGSERQADDGDPGAAAVRAQRLRRNEPGARRLRVHGDGEEAADPGAERREGRQGQGDASREAHDGEGAEEAGDGHPCHGRTGGSGTGARPCGVTDPAEGQLERIS